MYMVSSPPLLWDDEWLIIGSFTSVMCFTNSLWRCTFTSYELGRSELVDFGLIDTRGYRSGHRCIWVRLFNKLIWTYLIVRCNQFGNGAKGSGSRKLARTPWSLAAVQVPASLFSSLASSMALQMLCGTAQCLAGMPQAAAPCKARNADGDESGRMSSPPYEGLALSKTHHRSWFTNHRKRLAY